jgi:hypothetical protein
MTMRVISLLDAKAIGERNKRVIWKLNSPLGFRFDNGTYLWVPKGFESDFASVPRIPIVYMLWGDRAHRESILHDYFYRRDCALAVTRAEADKFFQMAMVSQGQPFYIVYPMYVGVRIGGLSSYHRMNVMDTFKLDVTYDESLLKAA